MQPGLGRQGAHSQCQLHVKKMYVAGVQVLGFGTGECCPTAVVCTSTCTPTNVGCLYDLWRETQMTCVARRVVVREAIPQEIRPDSGGAQASGEILFRGRRRSLDRPDYHHCWYTSQHETDEHRRSICFLPYTRSSKPHENPEH